MADDDSDSPEKKRQEPPPIEFLKPGEVQSPPPAPQGPAAWVTRPEDYQQPGYPAGPAPPRQAPAPGEGRTARIAGILLVLSAVVNGGYILAISLSPVSPAQYANATSDLGLFALSQVCSILALWAQAIMFLAGVMAFQRVNYRIAAGAAFISMVLLVGFALAFLDVVAMGGAALGVVGFVLTVVGRREFVS